MEEHALLVNGPFEYQELGQPHRIAYDGARLTITIVNGQSQINARLLAANLEFFYENAGDRLGVRFTSPSFPGARFELRFEQQEHRVTVFFEVRNGEDSAVSQVSMTADQHLYFHDQWEARLFPAPGAAAHVNEDPVAAPGNEDPVAPAARRDRRAGRRRSRRSRRSRRRT